MKLFVLLLFCIFSTSATAQRKTVEIMGSLVEKIQSKVVTQEYELQILLPQGFGKTDKRYPVVYLMDSQWDFPLLQALYGEQYYDGFIPELIVVGVTWGGNKPKPDSLRARDYTPTMVQWFPQSGGADKFLSFMKNELMPYVETHYQGDSQKRVLMGCSLGGLFTLYTMFTQPELFYGYVSASPAVAWDNGMLFSVEEKFAAMNYSKPIRLFMTVGDVELSVPVVEKMAKRLQERNYKYVTLESRVLVNTGHSGTKSETYSRGLQFIFQRPNLKLKHGVADLYAGTYSADNANLTFTAEDDNLYLVLSPQLKLKLFAASENEFYSTHEFFNIRFVREGSSVKHAVVSRYGSEETLNKVK